VTELSILSLIIEAVPNEQIISYSVKCGKTSQVKVKVTLPLMASQSVSPGVEPHYTLTVMVLFFWGARSDERTCLSFVYAAGPRQRSHFWVRIPWDWWPYFTVSDLRLPFSSPPTTRRVTVEVFEPTSTRVFCQVKVPRTVCQSQSYFTTGGLPPMSLSWRQALWVSWPEFFSPNWTLSILVLT
jgi:hypothetical protein